MRDTVTIRPIGSLPLAVRERFESKWMPEPNSGCWLWFGIFDKNGYGRFPLYLDGKNRVLLAHRISWEIYRGETNGLFVLHKCDVPACINPDHLFLGTQADNMADCARKGRAVGNRGLVVGEKHGMSKLTWEAVREIRDSSLTQYQLADKFGVHQSLVSLVQRRKIWREKET